MKMPQDEFLAKSNHRSEYCNRLFEKYRDEGCGDSLVEFFEIQRPLFFYNFVTIRKRRPEDFDEAWDAAVLKMIQNSARYDSAKGDASALLWYVLRTAFRNIYYRRNRGEKYGVRVIAFSTINSDRDDTRFEDTIPSREGGGDVDTLHNLDESEIRSIHDRIKDMRGTESLKNVASLLLKTGGKTAAVAKQLGISPTRVRQQAARLRIVFSNLPVVKRIYPGLSPTFVYPKTSARKRKPPALTANQAAVIELVAVQGLSEREAAARLGWRYIDVRQNLGIALKKIAESPELQTLTGIGPGMYGI